MYSIYDKKRPKEGVIVVSKTSWHNNRGVYGAAVDMTPLDSSNIENEGYLPVPKFSNCTYFNNTVNDHRRNKNRTYHLNVGVFSITHFKALFAGKTEFTSNIIINSALSLVSGVAEFQEGSYTLFRQNFGYDGGAIAMFGFSTILFHRNTSTKFSHNHAINHGGAISHHTIDQHSFLKSDAQCFIRNGLENITEDLIGSIKVDFEGNTARVGGDAIFVESIGACSHRCMGRNLDAVFDFIGKFDFTKNHRTNRRHLMTSAKKIRFCEQPVCVQ